MGIDDECTRIVLPHAVGIGGADEEAQMAVGDAVEGSTVHVVDIVPFVAVALKLIGIFDPARTSIVKGRKINGQATLVARHFQHGRVKNGLRLIVALIAHTGKGNARHHRRVAQVARCKRNGTAIARHEQIAVIGSAKRLGLGELHRIANVLRAECGEDVVFAVVFVDGSLSNKPDAAMTVLNHSLYKPLVGSDRSYRRQMEIVTEQPVVGDFLYAAPHDVDKDMTVVGGKSLQDCAAGERMVVATTGRGGEEAETLQRHGSTRKRNQSPIGSHYHLATTCLGNTPHLEEGKAGIVSEKVVDIDEAHRAVFLLLHTVHATAISGDPQTVAAVLKDVVDVVIAKTPTVVLIMDIVVHGFAVPAKESLALRAYPHPSPAVLLDRIDAVGKTCRKVLKCTRRRKIAFQSSFMVIDGQTTFAIACPKVAVTVKTQGTHLLVDDHRQPTHAMPTKMQHREIAFAREPEVVLVVDKRFLDQRNAGISRLTAIQRIGHEAV